MHKRLFLFACFILSLGISFAQGEKRLALIIGNSQYTSGELKNAVNDANKVSAKLKTLGFDVILKNNATYQMMDEAIIDFTDKASSYDVALFYYAGHGIQSKGSNYLIPVDDNSIRSEVDLAYKSENVNRILEGLEDSGCKLKIIILDACRNNPFERSWHRSTSSSGLASLNAPKGTLIAYATSPGSVADDGGDAQNSPYTTAFLQTLDKANLSILDFFNEVSGIVSRNTQNNQTPWVAHSPIDGNFKFNQVLLKKTDSQQIFPVWAKDVADRNLWLGVSPPMEDRGMARNVAIQNAVLYYLCANGGGALESKYYLEKEISQECLGKDIIKEMMKHSSLESASLNFCDFSIRIIHEYYNARGECFVACEVKEGNVTGNSMEIKREWSEGDGTGSIQFDVTSQIGGLKVYSQVIVLYNELGVSYEVVLGENSCKESYILEYPEIRFSSVRSGSGYEVPINQSLGVSQMSCLAMSPYITDSMKVFAKSFMESSVVEAKDTQRFSTTFAVESKGVSNGWNFQFYNVAQNSLKVAVKDFSVNVDDTERFLVGVGYFNDFQNRPLVLSKQKSYYNALYEFSQQTSMVFASQNDNRKTTIIESLSEIQPYAIDWCFNKETKQVRVVLESQKEKVKNQLKDSLSGVENLPSFEEIKDVFKKR